MSTRSLRHLLVGITSFLGLATLQTTQAFWSKALSEGYKIHQTITSTTLASPVYTFDTATTYQFSYNVIHVINDSHAEADSDPYDERDHFDNEAFASSFTRLATRRAQLMTDLSSGTPDMLGTDWPLVGYMLHQIQDFYSHSTWAKTHPTSASGSPSIANFGAATEPAAVANGLPSFLQGLPTPNAVCNSASTDPGSSLLSATPPLTTGYFDPGVLGSGVFAQPNPPVGRCAHGVLAYAITGCVFKGVGGDTGLPDGIAHDEPCFKLEEDLKIYADAYAMAQAETQSFIQAIVNDLLAQGNRQGFCYLFGLDQAQAPCVSPCAAKANTQNVSSEALSITTPPFVTTTSPISLQAAGATNELDLEGVSLTALMNAAGPVPVGFSGKVNPTPYTAGSYALLGYLPGYPNQPSVTVLTYGDSANPYDTQLFSVGTPNVVTVQTITHICSDDVAKTELDQFTGTINIGLLYELQPTSYTGLSLTGSFNSTAYLCQKGATAVGTPPASGTVVLAQTFRCQ